MKKKVVKEGMNERAKDIKEEIGRFSSMESLKLSEGGKQLITDIKKKVKGCMMTISSRYKECNHAELIALCAKLSANLDILETISGSTKRKNQAIEDLDEVLEEIEE